MLLGMALRPWIMIAAARASSARGPLVSTGWPACGCMVSKVSKVSKVSALQCDLRQARFDFGAMLLFPRWKLQAGSQLFVALIDGESRRHRRDLVEHAARFAEIDRL